MKSKYVVAPNWQFLSDEASVQELIDDLEASGAEFETQQMNNSQIIAVVEKSDSSKLEIKLRELSRKNAVSSWAKIDGIPTKKQVKKQNTSGVKRNLN